MTKLTRPFKLATLACLFLLSQAFDALAAPVANFTATPTSGCAPLVVDFTSTSTGTSLTYAWDFVGTGVTSTLQNPSVIYLSPGSYTVKLTVTDGSGLTNTKTVSNYIVVSAPPTINFSSVDTAGSCGPKTATFTNTTVLNSAGAGSYKWDFGDGSTLVTASSAALTHTYDTCGDYTVSLIATNSAGCSAIMTKTAYIHVYCLPVANFSSANANSCTVPWTVNFNAGSSTSATTYKWNFGDSPTWFTSAGATTTHNYTVGGTYTVKLAVTNANGCKDTLIRTGFVSIGAVLSNFTVSDTSVCTGNSVNFTNTTTPGAGNSIWYFNGTSVAASDTSHATSPSHTYSSAGTYSVMLVSDYSNCSDTSYATVHVALGPNIAFTASPLSACNPPLSVNFTNTTTGAATYLWIFGDSSPTSSATSPTHSYTTSGTFSVSLIATTAGGFCSDTLTKPNYIKIFQPTATITGNVNLGCAPATAAMGLSITSATSLSGYSYTWSWGDATSTTTSTTSSTHTYSSPGTYTITVTGTGSGASSGCSFTTSTLVFVGAHPSASFTASPNPVCYGTSVSFSNTSTGATTYNWYFGDGGTSTATAPSHNFAYPDSFTVMLVAGSYGCRDTFYGTVVVKDPKSNFTPYLPDCANRYQICFTNTSISAGPTVYHWDFGVTTLTNDTSNLINPCYTYTATGTYSVKLTVTNLTTGCTNIKTIPVKVFLLDAQFTTADTAICKGQAATFTATSDPGYVQYIWKYGDGTPADTQTTNVTSHTYNTAGIFTVKLYVKDSWGCTDSIVKTNHMHVGGLNTADFTATPTAGCIPLTVSFHSTSVVAGTTITNYHWYYGQGSANASSGTSPNSSYTYTIKDTFTVKVIITMADGCVDSVVKPDLISTAGPHSNFTAFPNKGCIGVPFNFTSISTGDTPLTYLWIYPTGATYTSATPPPITFATAGTKYVTLVVTDPYGCKDSLTKPIQVSNIDAHFTMSDSIANCPPLTVNFTNTSVLDSFSTGETFLWTFGNTGTSTIVNPSTTYVAPGTYTVWLHEYTTYGCQDSTSKTVTINNGPTGTLNYPNVSGCAPVTVNFTITGISNTTSITVDFQDGSTATPTIVGTTATFSHTYNQGGNFMPFAILNNSTTGCATTLTNIHVIHVGKPHAGFFATPSPACQFATVSFTDTSSSPALGFTTWAWNFGDPTSGAANTSSLQNPTHQFFGTGTKTVKLVVTDSTGCVDSVTRTIVITAAPTVDAGSNVTICTGGSTTLTATGASTYVWTPAASGLSCYSCASPVSTPAATTTYYVTGTATATGCTNKDSVKVTITSAPVAPTVTTPINYCQGDVASVLTATAAPGNTLKWYTVPTGGTALAGAPTPSTATATTLTWYVSQATSGGCEGPRTAISVIISATPPAPTVSSPVQYCKNATASALTATGLSGYTIKWYTVATGGVGSTTAPTPSTATVTTLNWWVSQTNPSSGCESPRANIQVIINALPTVPTVTTPITYCQFATASALTATAAAGMTLQWYTVASGGVASSTAPTPGTATVGSTTYYVSQKNTTTGCEGNRASIVVTVVAKPTVNAGLDLTICTGSTATLTATGATTYTWSPVITCSGGCATGTVSPASTTTYTVIGTTSGCADTDAVVVSVVSSPTVTVTPNPAVICNGSSVTLTASGASTYSWSPATGLSATTGAVVTASPTTTTTYVVTGIAGGGSACQDTAHRTVTVNPLPAAPTIVTPVNLCQYATASALTATAGAGMTLHWYTVATGGVGSTTAPTPSTATATTLNYWVSQSNNTTGCEGPRAHIVVNINAQPTVNAGLDQTICTGSTATLTATGAVNYTWSPAITCSGTCATGTVSPVATTTYTVIGTNALGCADTDAVVVSVVSSPTVTVAPNPAVICNGDSITLTASGASTYSWSPATGLSTTTGAVVIAHPTITTTYVVTGVAGGGSACQDTAHRTVTVNPLPAAPTIVTPVNLCQYATASALTATAGAGMTLHWYTVATGGVGSTTAPTPSTATATTLNYWVSQSNNTTGCEGPRAHIVVNINAQPTVNAGLDQTICTGSTATLTATGAVNYTWSPAITCSGTCATGTVSPVATTTYTVIGTNALGCADTDAVLVSVVSSPTVTVAPNPAVICNGDSITLTASGASTYSWSPATGLSTTTGAVVIAHPTTTTTYVVTGVAGGGSSCQDTAHRTVTVNPLPAAPTIVTPVNLCQYATASALSATAGAGMTLNWYTVATGGVGSTTAPTPSTATAGIFDYYVSQSNNITGCEGPRAHIVVNINAQPTVNAGLDQTICTGSTATLTATGAVNYTWSPAITCSGTCATGTVSPAVTTTYTVIGTNALGCSDTDAMVVNVVTNPVVSVTPSPATICNGDSVVLTATGASTYSWTPATGLSTTTGAVVTAHPTTTTTYVVTGTAGSGSACQDTAHVTVTVNPLPAAPVVTTPVSYCQFATAAVLSATAGAGMTLQWYTTATGGTASTTAPTPSTATAGIFTWYVSQQNNITGCEGPRATITVTINPKPTVNAGADVSVCAGGSATLTATGAATYTWSPAISCVGAACATGTTSPVVTTTYTVIGTTAAGCIDTDDVDVAVVTNPVLTITPSAASVCSGDSIQLTASGASVYSWSPSTGLSATTGSVVMSGPAATTTYTVIGGSGSGTSCADTATVTVTIIPLPPAPTVATPVNYCLGVTAVPLTATAAAGDTLHWYTTATGGVELGAAPTPSTTATGTTPYYVSQSNAAGCEGPRATINVIVNANPVVDAGTDQTVCEGSTVTLTASGAASYTWSPAISCTGTCATGTVVVSTTTTFTVIGTNGNGCSDTDDVVINTIANPVVTVTPATFTICPGGSVGLTASGATTYSWTPATGLSSTTIPDPIASPATTTTYVVTGSQTTGSLTCTDTAHATVSVNTSPAVGFTGDTTICIGESTVLTGTGATTFTWYTDPTLSCTSCTSTTATPTATTTYTVVGANGVGCSDTIDVTVYVHALPVITASTTTPVICPGTLATLSAVPSTGISYSWSPTVVCSGSCVTATVTPSVATTYTATGTDVYGCVGSDTVGISVFTAPTVTAIATPGAICPGDSTQLSAAGALSFIWLAPTSTLTCTSCSSPMASPASTITYNVEGTDGNSCKDTASVTVTVNPAPVVTTGANQNVCLGQSATLNASGAGIYAWSPASTLNDSTIASPIATPLDTTIYQVIGTNSFGCKDTAQVTVFTHLLPVINAGLDTSVCIGSGVQLNATPFASLNFFWTPAAGLSNDHIHNPIASPAVNTDYTVIAFDLFGCSDTDDVSVVVLPLPNVVATVSNPIICRGASSTLSATGAVSFAWNPGGLTGPIVTVSPTAPTTYTVIGTSGIGCTDTAQVFVDLYPIPSVSAGPDVTICEGQSTQLAATGGSSYVWSPAATLSDALAFNPLAQPDSTVTYTVIGTDGNGCQDSDKVVVTVIQLLPTNVGPGGEVCEGDTVQLSASGGTTYLWSPASGLSDPTSANPIANPTSTTTYTVIIFQGTCQVDSEEVTVIVDPVPTVSLGNDITLLSGTSVTLTPQYTNATTFLWTPSDGLSCNDCDTPIASPTNSITYTLYVANQYGCADSDDVTITVVCNGTQIWMPNTFTPNGDDQNDRFYVHGIGISKVESFKIYDRWGEVVYDAENIPINDINYSWDGTFRGVPLKPDVYIYTIKALCGTGAPIEFTGDISLVR